jgi:hypothetical protein
MLTNIYHYRTYWTEVGRINKHILFYSILFYSILFYSILFYSIPSTFQGIAAGPQQLAATAAFATPPPAAVNLEPIAAAPVQVFKTPADNAVAVANGRFQSFPAQQQQRPAAGVRQQQQQVQFVRAQQPAVRQQQQQQAAAAPAVVLPASTQFQIVTDFRYRHLAVYNQFYSTY